MIAPSFKYLKNGKMEIAQDWTSGFFIVPKGFVTDLASIPRILSPLFPKVGDNLPAAVLHDWLYSKKCTEKVDRKEADIFFLNMMAKWGVKPWRRYLMYYAVRLFGWMFYKKK